MDKRETWMIEKKDARIVWKMTALEGGGHEVTDVRVILVTPEKPELLVYRGWASYGNCNSEWDSLGEKEIYCELLRLIVDDILPMGSRERNLAVKAIEEVIKIKELDTLRNYPRLSAPEREE